MKEIDREKILLSALKDVCKVLRKNPPTMEYIFENNLLEIFAGSMSRDPEGMELVRYFISKAIEKEFKKED